MTKITIDRATVEQALEALIKNARLLGSTQAGKLFGSYSQEDAKFERMFNESIAKHKASIIAALEQLEHEPVGEVLNERGEVDYISYVPPVGTRLYTTPFAARRKPLTDEQLSEIMAAVSFTYNPTKFARAIESAHGIKEGA